jgi:GGDEF domain-containing protein
MFPETSHQQAGADMIRVAVAIHNKRGELIRMLTGSIRALSAASEEALRSFADIEEEIIAALELEDLECVKPQLAECLERIQRETAVRPPRPEPAESPAAPALDLVTGLQERHAAEAALERACYSQIPTCVVVIVLDSLPTINMRFGRNTGDALLQVFAEHLRNILPTDEELFRWTGPAFVALLRQPRRALRGREGFARLLEQKFEHTIQMPSRDIHLSPAKRYAILEIGSTPAALFEEIDKFISPALVSEGLR